MPKRLRDEDIYLAPEILASRAEDYTPHVFDERNGRPLNPKDIDDKIYIYERQVQEWFLARAKGLVKHPKNNFVVMMIATAYIEGIEQYRCGEPSHGNSKRFFKSGVKRIFNMSDNYNDKINKLYSHLRCGLYHNGMSGDAVVLNRTLKNAIEFSDRGTIDINPKLFLQAVVHDFDNYLRELRNSENTQLRQNFDTMFEVV